MPRKKPSKADQRKRRKAAAKAHLKKVMATHKKLEMELRNLKTHLKNPEPWWFGP